MPLLELDDVSAGYGGRPVIQGLSLDVEEHSIVGLIGRNGVGKTTTLRTIVGLIEAESGSITFDGENITNANPYDAYRKGISLVREDRGIFPDLTVMENLQVPLIDDSRKEYSIDELFEIFPRLEERKNADGNHLSGGEQQMLAIARALRSKPRLLLLDEPSEGLAPQIVQRVADTIEEIADSGTTILLVEQNVNLILDLSTYIYVMDTGNIVHEGPSNQMRENRDEMEQYLRVGHSGTD